MICLLLHCGPCCNFCYLGHARNPDNDDDDDDDDGGDDDDDEDDVEMAKRREEKPGLSIERGVKGGVTDIRPSPDIQGIIYRRTEVKGEGSRVSPHL